MPYLIDGNNFIGFIAQSELRNPQSRYTLIGRLLAFQEIKNTRIYLVFDGPPDPNITDSLFPENKFSVLYPDRGSNADAVIMDIILKQTDRRQFFVVSSDKEIKAFSRLNGAKKMDCKVFNQLLKATLKEHKKLKAKEKHATFPSPLEIHNWMDIFKTKK